MKVSTPELGGSEFRYLNTLFTHRANIELTRPAN